jgi:hypothetical protein
MTVEISVKRSQVFKTEDRENQIKRRTNAMALA